MQTVKFRAFPKQLELMKAVQSRKYSLIAYGGAMGGGKTFAGLAILQTLALEYAGSKWVVVRQSTPTLKKTTIPSFEKVKLGKRVKQFNRSENIVTFDNGSQIIFVSENIKQNPDLEHFKGLECNGFLLEQMEEIQEATLDICFLRIGRWIIPNTDRQPPNFILATINPAWNWVKEKIYDPWQKDALPKYKKTIDENGLEREELGWKYIQAKISDNPVLFNNKTYMSNFDRLDPVTYDRYVNGNWEARDKTGLFIYQFDFAKHIWAEPLDYKKANITLSFDFNVSPATCTAWQIGADFIYCVKEFRIENCDVYDMCAEILAAFPLNTFFVTGDASGNNRSFTTRENQSTYDIIDHEFRTRNKLRANEVPTRNPPIRHSRELTNSILKNFEGFRIHESCKFTIEDLQSVKATANGGIDKRDQTRGHLLDTVRYLLWTYYKDYITDYNFLGNDDDYED